jgi:hypothetical protein
MRRRIVAMVAAFLLAGLIGSCHSDGTAPLPGTQPPPDDSVRLLVGRLDFAGYKAAINALSQFGDRTQGTQGNALALSWIESELTRYGYVVERHDYTFTGTNAGPRQNIYATKVGATAPQEMYIVSAHMDGRGGGQGADDDASGCALLLELARVLGASSVRTDRSVRFIFWNNEETGLNGSAAYVADRAALQGRESPAGSGKYPEPMWLGMIQHDMLLFDHGLTPSAEQSPTADIDVEYQANSARAPESAELAAALRSANVSFATDYPAEVSDNMNNTDSRSFQNHAPSISLRENRRVAEIGNGANPHWHKTTDLYATYGEKDFRLGFNAAQTTLGAVSRLAGARIRP